MMQRKSDIPQEAIERVIREYREEGQLIDLQVTECIVDGQVVGQREYDAEGNLCRETPLKNGKKHGREYIWNEHGELESMEPYRDGHLHGIAKQYGRHGKVIGMYHFVRGTGYDIWRHQREDGSTAISEIHSVRDGALHGFECWLRGDQRSVWHERHWQQGKVHGIERMWNAQGRLKRGYPRYWLQGQAVTRRAYLKAAKDDESLPKYKESDDRPQRKFPDEIERLLSG